MILPRRMIPKIFTLHRIEGAILASYRPTMPKFKVVKSAKERSAIGVNAAWAKRAKRLARTL